MPMVDLTLPAGALDEEHRSTLVEQLTDLIIKWEEGTEVPGYGYAAWTYVHEAQAVAIAGKVRPAEKAPLYRVVISVPKGSLNEERKAGLVADVTEAIMDVEPRALWKRDPHRVWCIVNDVPDGDWGAGGRILRLRDLVDMFGETLPPERHAEFEFGKK
jgi:phenylpyruvate tautomerase PptA (4-oxalocrotonate tautomerase family)